MTHGSGPTSEAACDELSPELGCIAASLIPTAVEVLVIGPEDAAPWRFAPKRCGASTQPATDGLSFGANHGGDALDGYAHSLQSHRLLVTRLPPRIGFPAASLSRRRHRGRTCFDRPARGQLFSGLPADLPDPSAVIVDNSTNGVANVAQQMPTVSYLDGIGRSLAHTVGIGTCTVACDHFDTRVLSEPGSQRFRLPIRQEVDHLVAFQIDQNRSIAMATAPSPVVDGKHTRRRRRLLAACCRSCHTQQRIGAERHRDPGCHSRPCFPTKRQRQITLQLAKSLGSAGTARHIVETLGKGLASTMRIEAPEPPGLYTDCHLSAARWQVTQLSQVAAMNSPRNDSA